MRIVLHFYANYSSFFRNLASFLLIVLFRVNAFISFIIVTIGIGIGQGMKLDVIVNSIEKGIGNTLGFLVLILGLGAMLGKL